jgi:hypothetical protein
MKNFIKNHTGIVCILVFVFVFIPCSFLFKNFVDKAIEKDKYHSYTRYEIYTEMNQLTYDSIKSVLVEQVNSYIQQSAPTSALDGLVVVNKCIDYDIDICFVLAQGEIESHFGTKGLARKTNSVFNVYAFDGKELHEINKNGKYRHPDDSVEPYIELLKREYLVENKTEYDMLKKYVNYCGNRYASAPDYEQKLSSKIEKIQQTTDIENTYQLLKKQAYILGID